MLSAFGLNFPSVLDQASQQQSPNSINNTMGPWESSAVVGSSALISDALRQAENAYNRGASEAMGKALANHSKETSSLQSEIDEWLKDAL